MKSSVNVFLFGSLLKGKKAGDDAPVQVELQKPLTLQNMLELLDIQPQEVSLAMINYKSVPKNWLVQPGDRLSLFPREYPIFADWLDHRLNV
ncbi:MAG: hypothetical protein HY879_14320 [Deltaproteobacteria bacterium]|nr:hypothetical protein [Deltaproteobacteria bacterium]